MLSFIFVVAGTPVIIEDGVEKLPAKDWTLQSLCQRVGPNEVFVRTNTNVEEYRVSVFMRLMNESVIYFQLQKTYKNLFLLDIFLLLSSIWRFLEIPRFSCIHSLWRSVNELVTNAYECFRPQTCHISFMITGWYTI